MLKLKLKILPICRNFDCLLFGDKGVKIVPPEQGFPVRPGDVEIDDGDDDIEDYDENVVRKRRADWKN